MSVLTTCAGADAAIDCSWPAADLSAMGTARILEFTTEPAQRLRRELLNLLVQAMVDQPRQCGRKQFGGASIAA